MNRTGLVEGELSRQRLLSGGVLTVVLVLGFDGCEVSDRGVQPVLVEPMHPGEGCELELIDGSERAVDLDTFVLVETDDGLGEVVVRTRSEHR